MQALMVCDPVIPGSFEFALAQEALGMFTCLWDVPHDRVEWSADPSPLFGMAPSAFSTTRIFSPGLAVISVTEYFIVSEPVISTVRAAPAGAALPAAAAGAFLV